MYRRPGFFIRCAVLSLCLPPALCVCQIAVAQEKAGPIFKDGEAQIVPAFKNDKEWIKHDLWVETSFDTDGDGKLDRMHVDVTRQKQTDTEGLKVPVVYNSSPYFSGTAKGKDFFWDAHQELGAAPPKHADAPEVQANIKRPLMSKRELSTWVPRGFAVVHSASPGTGLSQGCPTVGGDNESLAPKAVVDWLCGRAKGYTKPEGTEEEVKAFWCTGKVGMTGTSYNGTIPLAAATTGVDGLEAIIPIAPNTSYYHYYRSNGMVRHPGGYIGEDIDVLYDFINSGDPENREYCNTHVRDEEMAKGRDRSSGDYNDFWAGRDYLNDMAPLKAAVLMSHAFNDWNVMPEHSVRIYEAVKKKGVPHMCYFHQGGHGGPPPLKLRNRWFSRYLYGVENGVENDPKSWIVRENNRQGKNNEYSPVSYPDYPNPAAQDVTMHLQAGAPGIGKLDVQPGSADQAPETVVDNYSFDGAALAQAEWTEHRLMFATQELTQPLHLSGTAKITVRMSCNKPATNLSVWLVSLPWNPKARRITENVITRGWADPQNRNSISKSEPLVPGEFYDVTFALQPDDQIIAAGQKIGLMIFASDKDYTLWPKPGTRLTVDLNRTKLTLPIVGGAASFK